MHQRWSTLVIDIDVDTAFRWSELDAAEVLTIKLHEPVWLGGIYKMCDIDLNVVSSVPRWRSWNLDATSIKDAKLFSSVSVCPQM